jgi:hypothetical protein
MLTTVLSVKKHTPAGAGVEVTPRGFEPSHDSSGNTRVSKSRGNKSGNIGPDSGPTPTPTTPATPPPPTDPDLSAVVAAWPTLPPAIRAGMLALVKAGTTA